MTHNSLDFLHRSLLGWGNRGWLEIINSILLACANGALKTHIMYQCNLNSRQVHQYLEFLIDRQLLEKKQVSFPKKWEYKTTELGWKYMTAYRVLSDIFKLEAKVQER